MTTETAKKRARRAATKAANQNADFRQPTATAWASKLPAKIEARNAIIEKLRAIQSDLQELTEDRAVDDPAIGITDWSDDDLSRFEEIEFNLNSTIDRLREIGD